MWRFCMDGILAFRVLSFLTQSIYISIAFVLTNMYNKEKEVKM